MTQLSNTLEEIYENSRKDPHKTLFLSVIFQAILDVTKPKKDNEDSEINEEEEEVDIDAALKNVSWLKFVREKMRQMPELDYKN